MTKDALKVVADKVQALIEEGVEAKDKLHVKVKIKVNVKATIDEGVDDNLPFVRRGGESEEP